MNTVARVIFAAVAGAMMFGLAGCDGPPPNDTKMIETFRSQRQTFEALRETFCALPHAQTVWLDSNDSDPKMPPWRRDPIVILMKKAGATRVASLPAHGQEERLGPAPCSVEITLWSSGALDGGDVKSIEFSPAPDRDDLALQSLDNIDFKNTVHHFPPPSPHGHRIYKRHLEGDWWLVWQHWE